MKGGVLVGRAAEMDVLDEMLDRIRERGAAVVVRGEPGIGKTSLLAAAKRRANERAVTVLRTSGVQTEADLAFSGLHQLLRPILPGLRHLPAPQRDAVSGAFGLAAAPVTDPFLIALGSLSLLADAADRVPLLVLVEDFQWIDRPTAEVLAFVARRVESEPIVVLFALRDGFATPLDLVGLREMRLEGLADDAAGELIDAHLGGLPAELKRRVMRMAAGNPLALVELPGVLKADTEPGVAPVATSVPLTTRLERAFADQGSGLPEATGTVLLVAAADEQLVLSELLAAAALIVDAEVTANDLDPAVAAGLVAVDGGQLRFRHPLVRSALYQAAGVSERQAAHAALAEVLSAQPDRRVWHRAASCLGPDEAVASELDRLATRLTRQGAVSVAVGALERAGRLSPDSATRCARLLRAAELAFQIGRRELVERLVLEAEQLGPDRQQQAHMTWLREIFTDGVPGDRSRVCSLVAAAEESKSLGDTDLALSLLLGAALRCWWADPGERARDDVVRAAEGTSASRTDPRLVVILAVAAPIECEATVIERLESMDPATEGDPLAAFLIGMAAHAVGDYERATEMFDRAIPQLRAQGRLALLAQVLTMRAWGAIPFGDWGSAGSFADEGERLARETVQPIWIAGALIARALLAGVHGNAELAETLLTEAEVITVPRRLGDLLCVGALARGLTALAAGRYEDAFDQLRRMFDPSDPAFHAADRFMGIGSLADAAVQSGHRTAAATILGELEALATLTSSPALRLGILYARAILADDDHAERLYLDALTSELGAWPFLRARLQLGYGAWLRRSRRIAESRAPLRAARDTFDALRTLRWAERARQELRASGERSRRRVPETRDELTPQELQIAKLAASGLSNRDIGQQLYLSPRTVASHLYRLFPKLGITSRSQLAGALRTDRESSVRS